MIDSANVETDSQFTSGREGGLPAFKPDRAATIAYFIYHTDRVRKGKKKL